VNGLCHLAGAYRGHDDVQPSPFFQATCSSLCRLGPGPSAPHEHRHPPWLHNVMDCAIAAVILAKKYYSRGTRQLSRLPVLAFIKQRWRPRC
jgi:hypothetical protein